MGVRPLKQRHHHAIYRLTAGSYSYVLKWFAGSAEAIEVRAYTLLMRLGVPTLPLHGHTTNTLLLEDLDASPTWRLATADDMEHSATGVAVAAWYRALHAAGDVLMAEPNDFHWSNLALSRHEPLRAVVFDYHLLGIGPRAADHRNVTSILTDDAQAAFVSAYGPVDEREMLLDAPVAILHALQVAAERLRLPRWAVPLIYEVRTGVLETKLRRALALPLVTVG